VRGGAPIPVLTRYRDLPYAKILVWFRGGSSVEAPEELGWAHLTEHLLFKPRHAGATLAEFVESLGGSSNAFTSQDAVAVEATVRVEDVDRVLAHLSAVLSLPLTAIARKDLDEERSVVIEELRMYRDEPTENLFNATMRNLYPGHPYGREIIGEEETLRDATGQTLERFLREKLSVRPFVVVAGGYRGAPAFSLPWRDAATPVTLTPWETARRFTLSHRQKKAYFMAGWRLPPESGETLAAARLIHLIVHGMEGSRFYHELVYEHGTFDNMTVHLLNGFDALSFLHSLACDPSREPARVARWMREWDRVEITREEVAKARETILSDESYAAEGVGAVAETMARGQALYGDPARLERDHFWHLLHLSASELRAFKETHLSWDRAVAGAALPAENRFSFTTAAHRVAATTAKRAPGLKERPQASVRFRESDRAPFVSLYALKQGGAGGGLPGKPGSLRLFWETLTASAEGLDRTGTDEFLDRHGIILDPIVGNNTSGIRLKMRDSSVREAVDIFARVLRNRLHTEDLAQEKAHTLANLSLKGESPESLLRDHARRVMFAGTAYADPLEGTVGSVAPLTLADLRATRRLCFASGRWGLGVSGAADRSFVEDIAAALPHHRGEATGDRRSATVTLDDRVETVAIPEKDQIHIVRLFRAPGIYDADFETMRLIEQLLTGQRSPYFQALREEQGLVYHLDIWSMGGLREGLFALYAITSPAHRDRVMDRMTAALAPLRTGALAPDLFAEAKNTLAFDHARSLTRNDFHALNLALEGALGLPRDHYLALPSLVSTLSVERMAACAAAYLTNGIWLVSGGDNERE